MLYLKGAYAMKISRVEPSDLIWNGQKSKKGWEKEEKISFKKKGGKDEKSDYEI